MSIIKPEDTWLLWAFLVGWAAVSIYLEQHYQWAAKMTGAIIGLIGALVLANLKVIPTASPVYDAVWDYVVPIAVVLLLFKADLGRIVRESGPAFLAFNISAFGTVLGAFVGFFLLRGLVPHLAEVAGMMTGSYVGGGVNFVAMAAAFKPPESVINAAVVADNLNMALYFFVLLAIPNILFFRRHFPHPHEDKVAVSDNGTASTAAAAYWKSKEISLQDIALAMGTAMVIAAAATKVAGAIKASSAPWLIKMIFGQQYLMLTTFTVALATLFPKFFSRVHGTDELGTFLIYLFYVVIGVPASIELIIKQSPLLLVFCAIMVIVNMLVTLVVGKLFRFNLEELLIASNANIGGPTTAAAMAIAKGWTDLVVPAILIGVWGYVIGNYLGLFVGNVLL